MAAFTKGYSMGGDEGNKLRKKGSMSGGGEKTAEELRTKKT